MLRPHSFFKFEKAVRARYYLKIYSFIFVFCYRCYGLHKKCFPRQKSWKKSILWYTYKNKHFNKKIKSNGKCIHKPCTVPVRWRLQFQLPKVEWCFSIPTSGAESVIFSKYLLNTKMTNWKTVEQCHQLPKKLLLMLLEIWNGLMILVRLCVDSIRTKKEKYVML